MEEAVYALWLSACFGYEYPEIHRIIDTFGSAEAFFESGREDEEFLSTLSEEAKKRVREVGLDRFSSLYDSCMERNISVLSWNEEQFPEELFDDRNSPIVLFAYGDLSLLNDHLLVTMIGDEPLSDYSKRLCGNISFECSKSGAVVVSDLSSETGRYVQLGAAKAGAPSVGVMEVLSSNASELVSDVMKRKGLLLSLFPPGSKNASPGTENVLRLVNTLSEACAVIQIALGRNGEAMLKKRLEDEKEFHCIPPADLYDKRYSGVIPFLRGGRKSIYCARDLLEEYLLLYPELTLEKLLDYYDGSRQTANRTVKVVREAPKPVKTGERVPVNEDEELSKKPSVPDQLSMQEKAIYRFLEYMPRPAESISRKAGMDAEEGLKLLQSLEQKGYSFSCSGNLFGLLNK